MSLLITLLAIIYVGVCVVLVLVVLMQEGKSGGLAGSETASQTPGALSETFGAGGAQKTLFNTTSWLAAVFFILAISLTLLGGKISREGGSLKLEGDAPAAAATTLPATEAPATAAPAGDAPAAPATPAP
jgi:preprotein translocase subunit SecG